MLFEYSRCCSRRTRRICRHDVVVSATDTIVIVLVAFVLMTSLTGICAVGAEDVASEFAHDGEADERNEDVADSGGDHKRKRRRFNRFSVLSTLFDRLGLTKMQKMIAVAITLFVLIFFRIRPARRRRAEASSRRAA